MTEIYETLRYLELGLRGTGRTRRTVETALEWALNNPGKKGVIVAANWSSAKEIQKQLRGFSNMEVIGLKHVVGLRNRLTWFIEKGKAK